MVSAMVAPIGDSLAMSQAALKIVEKAQSAPVCIHCGGTGHTLLFRKPKHDIVECDNCGFPYLVGVQPGSQRPES